MPSASTGRYQSKLFNFVHRQSRRFTQQLGQSFRQLKVATKWGIELLIFPIYKIFESVEKAGKQLPSQTPQSHGASVSTDTPIKRVLQEVKSQESSSLKLVKIRGIASRLSDQMLVLVTDVNEIIDTLTSQQQQFLEEKIAKEVARYQSHQQEEAVKSNTQTPREIELLLNRLIGDDSQKTSNLALTNGSTENEYEKIPETPQIIAKFDAVLAKLENSGFAPLIETSTKLFKAARKQLNIFVYGKNPSTEINSNNSENSLIKTEDKKIQENIWVTINSLLGVRPIDRLEQKESSKLRQQGKRLSQRPTRSFSPSHRSQKNETEDAWLTMKDLFGDEQINTPSLPSASSSTSPKDILNRYNQFIQPQVGGEIVQQQKSPSDITPKQKTSGKIATKKASESTLTKQQSKSSSQVEAKPDWIETEAEPVGYEKHALEHVLEWLDGFLLWLEGIFASIFRILLEFVRGKSK